MGMATDVVIGRYMPMPTASGERCMRSVKCPSNSSTMMAPIPMSTPSPMRFHSRLSLIHI